MDVNGNLNLRSWGFLDTPDSTLKNHLGLQLMSSISEKPLFGSAEAHDHVQHHPPPSMVAATSGGPFLHHRVGCISESHIPIDYWMNPNREKYLNAISGNQYHSCYQPSYGISPETSSVRSTPIPQSVNLPKNDKISPKPDLEHEGRENGGGPIARKRGSGQPIPNPTQKEKKARIKAPRDGPGPSSLAHHKRAPKKQAEIEINGLHMDVSRIPIPVCSCTGTPHQCYRWGSGGWQSACCTMGLSVYPLPLSTKRRGARIAGRKMSIGAFKKVLEKLMGEGYDFSSPIDLRSYWAKHGTNKFVTIR